MSYAVGYAGFKRLAAVGFFAKFHIPNSFFSESHLKSQKAVVKTMKIS